MDTEYRLRIDERYKSNHVDSSKWMKLVKIKISLNLFFTLNPIGKYSPNLYKCIQFQTIS